MHLSLTSPSAADLERLRGGLRIIALRALGDLDAADEAVQEALSRAVVALAEKRLDDPAKLPSYVAGIVRHVCSHLLRDRKDTLSIEGDVAGSLGVHPQLQTQGNPLESLISAAESKRLEAAFRVLSADDQKLLRLCFHEGRSPAEVATMMGEPGDRVRKRKERALDRLRHAFLGADTPSHDDATGGTSTVAPLMPTDKGRTRQDD
jgi:RNA polymerase sigma factor (sigma-70 family)